MANSYEQLTSIAESLVRDRITGRRKGLPDLASEHSFRVRALVARHRGGDGHEDVLLAALLHDVVEDGGVTPEELRALGFSARTVELVGLCTHPMSVPDVTERWVLMVARLIEARDADAWRIKVADLADNLSQCHALPPDRRRFMIEAKAPILLRVAAADRSARRELEERLEEQRARLERDAA